MAVRRKLYVYVRLPGSQAREAWEYYVYQSDYANECLMWGCDFPGNIVRQTPPEGVRVIELARCGELALTPVTPEEAEEILNYPAEVRGLGEASPAIDELRELISECPS